MRLAERMSRLGTETAFEVLAKAKALEAQGKHIVHLEIGEPDFDTPINIRDAAKKALDSGWTHYNPSAGLLDVREAICRDMKRRRNIDVTPDMVVVTPGAKPIMFFVILALAQNGDEVIYPNPGFPIYESVIRFSGATPVPIRLREERDFSFDADELISLITDQTRLIILNSPQNPTGGIIKAEDLKKVADAVRNRDLMILSDEVYINIIYEGAFATITGYQGMLEKTIILDGLSKTYAMTGWRIGYGVMRPDLAAQVAKLQTNSNSCTNSFVQRAAIEAIEGPQEESAKMVAEFKKRRDFIVEGLNKIQDFSCRMPKGAFYVFPNITKTGMTSRQLETFLLEKAGVAGLSGTSFGEYGEGYLRFSYANSIENIGIALNRIADALKKR